MHVLAATADGAPAALRRQPGARRAGRRGGAPAREAEPAHRPPLRLPARLARGRDRSGPLAGDARAPRAPRQARRRADDRVVHPRAPLLGAGLGLALQARLRLSRPEPAPGWIAEADFALAVQPSRGALVEPEGVLPRRAEALRRGARHGARRAEARAGLARPALVRGGRDLSHGPLRRSRRAAPGGAGRREDSGRSGARHWAASARRSGRPSATRRRSP